MVSGSPLLCALYTFAEGKDLCSQHTGTVKWACALSLSNPVPACVNLKPDHSHPPKFSKAPWTRFCLSTVGMPSFWELYVGEWILLAPATLGHWVRDHSPDWALITWRSHLYHLVEHLSVCMRVCLLACARAGEREGERESGCFYLIFPGTLWALQGWAQTSKLYLAGWANICLL